VEGYIEYPDDEEKYTVLHVKDVVKETLNLLKDKETSCLSILYFLNHKEHHKLLTYFEGLKRSDIAFAAVVFAVSSVPAAFPEPAPELLTLRTGPISAQEYRFFLRQGFETIERERRSRREEAEHMIRLIDAWNDQESLIHIGRSLSIEKDPDKLLRTILYFSKKITGADAGSIFIVEKEGNKKFLRFKYSHTFSMDFSYEEFTMPLDTNSIAGYVAVTGQVLNLEDVYDLGDESPVSFNPTFDREHGYRTKSMLVLPMRNHLDEIIGVIQLINSKEPGDDPSGNEAFEIRLKTEEDFETRIHSFDQRYESLMEAIAGQAAIALENNRMLLQIEHQFEEFVKASVTAIESRDPATSGHSFRVASMCVNTARAINETGEGYFQETRFTDTQLKEIEFAGLLHDFGKVYLDPAIFLKDKKLYPMDFAYLMMRLNFLYRTLELKGVTKGEKKGETKQDLLARIRDIMAQVTRLNEPNVEDGDPGDIIERILCLSGELDCRDLSGEPIPVLEDREVQNLTIRKGSLNDEERRIIESHVEHTYTFVSKIPWPDEFRSIPEIARTHHEKLDGTGYPLGLSGRESVPVAARIMAIADIFDALNATDRPYKAAVPRDRIFEILKEEAGAGRLDPDIVDIFISSRAWDTGEET
jgi:HD-GYP domain-containing protein (c-di-GMP phosphodiesterase class II)